MFAPVREGARARLREAARIFGEIGDHAAIDDRKIRIDLDGAASVADLEIPGLIRGRVERSAREDGIQRHAELGVEIVGLRDVAHPLDRRRGPLGEAGGDAAEIAVEIIESGDHREEGVGGADDAKAGIDRDIAI